MRRKFDPDELLSQTLIWVLLISYIAVVYVAVVIIGTLPFSDSNIDFSPPWWLNLLALVAIAATFLPVYRRVRASVRELIYGQHENPYPALAQLNQYLESTPMPQAILPIIAETMAHTLKLPYIEIEAQPARANHTDVPLVSAFGSPPQGAEITRVPLTYHDTTIGELRVAARRWDEPLSHSDLTVLRNLARQVGIALYAAQLTDDLQRARERLVIAREEERRRIRNDLHDGLAPTLSSLQLQLGAVRNLMRENPDQAETVINDLRGDLRNATAEIRQLVYDLRPPMLDELGLVGAIKNFKFQGSEISFEMHAPEPMPRLSAAVEVAVYRIASEAIHNVVKHAHATTCVVSIEIGDRSLTLSVTDNGTSLPHQHTVGVGLHSMQERVAELGGTLAVQSCESGGTCLVAQLPIDAQA